MLIADIIERAVEWNRSANDLFFTALLADGVEYDISTLAFSNIDTRLPAVMDQIVSDTYLRARAIRTTLKLWTEPQPFLRYFLDESNRYPASIHSLLSADPDGDVVLAVLTDEIDTLSNGTKFACGIPSKCIVSIGRDELEAEYPGCLLRIECFQALGLNPKELARQVFACPQNASTVEAQLPALDTNEISNL